MKLDWKEKFPQYLSPAGNMKRSLTPEQKTEIFAYRVSDSFKVLGVLGKNTREPVLCECVICGSAGSIIPDNAVRGVAACKTCKGTATQKESIDHELLLNNSFGIKIPEHILHAIPRYAGIIGSKNKEMGMAYLNTTSYNWKELMFHDMVFVVRHGSSDYFSVVTCRKKHFKNRLDACLWGMGIPTLLGFQRAGNHGAADEDVRGSILGSEHSPSQTFTGKPYLYARQTHGHLKVDTNAPIVNGAFGIWYTPKAPLVKFAIETRFRNRIYWPDISGGYDEVYYKLTQEDLECISALEHIDDAMAESFVFANTAVSEGCV